MGHLGLLPQTAKKYSVQGKTEDDACVLLEDSKALEDAGCFTIVYEMVASETCLLYTSPSPRDRQKSRMPSSA